MRVIKQLFGLDRWLLLALGTAALAAPTGVAQTITDGCTDAMYLDRTADDADRLFDWDYSFAGDPERCLVVRVGQNVEWRGNFGDHPLDADEGDRPNPIADHAAGLVTFDRAGVFGFRCNFHLAMQGAIKVVGAAPVARVAAFEPGHALTLALSVLLVAVALQRVRRVDSR